MTRNQRNKALKDFNLVDEMPFCAEENDMEKITSYLDNVAIKRVDKNLLDNKKRRIQSKRRIERLEIDDVVVKALMRLTNAVTDCFTYERQANTAKQQATQRKVVKTVREQKANQLARQRLHEEMQRRTMLRQNMINRSVQERIKEEAVSAIKAKEEDALAQRQKANKKVLLIAEDNFERDMRDEADQIEEIQRKRRIQKHAQVDFQRKSQRDQLVASLYKLRSGMDQLDSQADKMVHHPAVIQ